MITQSTFDFLNKLKKNNNKEWFDKNREQYERAKAEMTALVEHVLKNAPKFDRALVHLEAKKCLFRINRDIRFVKDKTPYKINLSADVSPGGKGSPSAGYYIHIQPGNCFLAGGVWMPEAPVLSAIRQEIDYNAKEFSKILSNKDFKKYFGALSDEDKLKTVPKGYAKDHPQIELLKNKSFLVVHDIKDKDVLSKSFPTHLLNVFKAMYPLHAFLRRAND
jgi:uncharacterized protein (TIGR02453 family)